MNESYKLAAIHQRFYPELMIYFEIKGEDELLLTISLKDLLNKTILMQILSKSDVEEVLRCKKLMDDSPKTPGGKNNG